MSTLSDLLTDVRSRLNEVIPRFWTDADLTRYINEAVNDIACRTETIQDTKNYNIVANQQNYDMPSDMLRIYRVEFRQNPGSISYPLEFQTMANMDDIWLSSRELPGGFPRWYSMWGIPGHGSGQIYIYPACSSNISNGMRIYYYRLAHPMVASTDIAEIPVGWENLVSLYVEVIARRKEAKDRRWQEAAALYEAALAEMVKTTRQWTDQELFFSPAQTPVGMLPWAGPYSSDWSW